MLWPRLRHHEVLQGHPSPSNAIRARLRRYTDQPEHEWPAWTNEFVERMRALRHELAKVKLRLLVAAGEPGAEIVRIAREHSSDLVILAWRGMWEAERACVVKAVVQRCPSPVLIVRTAR